MRTSRSGYLMAMLAGLAIVGASTGGVVVATNQHEHPVDVAASPAAAAANQSPQITHQEPTSSPSGRGRPAESSPTAAGSGASASTSPSSTGTPVPTTTKAASRTPITATPGTVSTGAAAPAFKDGKYSATGSYNSPGGIEKLGVTITLAADKVAKSNLDLLGGAGLSHSFQTAFASGYSSQVIGKDIASLSLGAVSGSSLTALGFNDALKQIETEARIQK